jgi:hypothetical protein
MQQGIGAAVHAMIEPAVHTTIAAMHRFFLYSGKSLLCCAAFRLEQGLMRIFQRDNACATLVLAVALQQIKGGA